MFFFFKWPPVAILNVQKSLITISDQYHNIYFCDFLQNGCRPPCSWMSKTHFRWHFWPFQNQYQTFFSKYFYKMATGAHFGCPKFTFERISGHFRSICNFNFFLIFDKMTAVDHISGHFRSIRNKIIFLIFFYKMTASAHFGCLKFTFNRISGHFRSIRNFNFLEIFDKMAAVGHFGCPKFNFDSISGHFRSIRNFIFIWKFWQNGCRRPLWMSEIHFRSHFWPFYFNTDFFFGNFLEIFDKMAAGAHFGCPKFTFDRIYGDFRSIRNYFFWKFWQNGCRRPFWMSEIHFRSHFSPF